jgi:hypothetical protein
MASPFITKKEKIREDGVELSAKWMKHRKFWDILPFLFHLQNHLKLYHIKYYVNDNFDRYTEK